MVVIDMDLPINCCECPLLDGEYNLCNADSSIRVGYDERPARCPIKGTCKWCEKILKKI